VTLSLGGCCCERVRRCGLQTGDTSLNTEADIVVMTTEILRNIMYRCVRVTPCV
jgi:superfamily II RNA helicase